MNIPRLSVSTLADCDPANAYASAGTAPTDQSAIAGVADPATGYNFGTGTTAPVYVASSAINGLPAIRFQPIQAQTESDNIALTIPSGLNFNGQSCSVYVVARGINVQYGSSDGNCLFALGAPATAGHPCFYTASGTSAVNMVGTDYKPSQLTAMSENPGIWSARFTPGVIQMGLDGQNYNVSASVSTSLTGGFIGNVYGSGFQYPFNGEIYRVLFFASPLSNADDAILRAYLSAKYGVTAWNSQITIGCESNVSAEYGPTGNVYGKSALCQALQAGLLSKQTKLVNMGVPGQQLATVLSQIANYTGLLNSSLTGTGGHVVVMQGGWNDLINGASVSTVLSRHASVGQACRNAGLRYVVLGIPDSSPSYSQQANALLVNAGLAANWPAFADAYIPVPAQLSNYANTAYFQSDGLHLTAAGQLVWAQVIAPIANKLLNLQGVGLPAASSSAIGTTNTAKNVTGNTLI
jgi:hypothetical protein